MRGGRTPKSLGRRVRPLPRCLISFDIGTNAGWAVFVRGRRVRSGTWLLLGHREAKYHDKPKELRFPRYLKKIRDLVDECRDKYDCEPVIAYEEVRFSASTDAAHIHGGLRAQLHVVCFGRPKPLTSIPVPVGTWKRLVVGNGSAKQGEYVRSINELMGLNLLVEEEDEAAAIGVGLAALLQEFHDVKAKAKSTRGRRRGRGKRS